MPLESDLYAPVKALLEGQGYVVKGEVRGCDVVAVRGDEPPVIVELKRVFGLSLVLQGVDRLALSDRVYLAVGQWPKQMKNVKKLCRRLGLGPPGGGARAGRRRARSRALQAPRATSARLAGCSASTAGASAIPTSAAAPCARRLMTAYRQEALRCAALLASNGPMKLAAVRAAADAPRAASILRDDFYGWFERVERGVYTLTPAGKVGLSQYGPEAGG